MLQRQPLEEREEEPLQNGVPLQKKLTVGPPGDPFEQKADRVADVVMRMPQSEVQRQVEEEET